MKKNLKVMLTILFVTILPATLFAAPSGDYCFNIGDRPIRDIQGDYSDIVLSGSTNLEHLSLFQNEHGIITGEGYGTKGPLGIKTKIPVGFIYSLLNQRMAGMINIFTFTKASNGCPLGVLTYRGYAQEDHLIGLFKGIIDNTLYGLTTKIDFSHLINTTDWQIHLSNMRTVGGRITGSAKIKLSSGRESDFKVIGFHSDWTGHSTFLLIGTATDDSEIAGLLIFDLNCRTKKITWIVGRIFGTTVFNLSANYVSAKPIDELGITIETFDDNIFVNEEVTFDAVVPNENQEYFDGLQVAWDFNSDGVLEVQPTLDKFSCYAFEEPGVYTVTLLIFGENGDCHELTKEIRVKSIDRLETTLEISNYNPFVGEEGGFEAVVPDENADYFDGLQVAWDFNSDGVLEVQPTFEKSASYAFEEPGVYLVKLLIFDGTGFHYEIIKEITVESEALDLPELKTVDGSTTIFVDENLTVRTLAGTSEVDNSGRFENLVMLNTGNGQVIFVENGETPLGVAYITSEQVASGIVQITSRELALGLISLNPYITVLSPQNRSMVLEASANHYEFALLKDDVKNSIINAPELALDYETYPYIFQTSTKIGIETIMSLDGSGSLARSYAGVGEITDTEATNVMRRLSPVAISSVSQMVGEEDCPHIIDKAGPEITLVNPLMSFYGFQANENSNLVRGRSKVFNFFPPWRFGRTAPCEKDWNLGDGVFDITIYSGFNIGTEGWLDYRHSAGKATYANLAKVIFICLDIGGMDFMSLDNSVIENLLLLDNVPNIDLGNIATKFKEKGWQYVLLHTMPEFLRNHWDEISYWLWQDGATGLAEGMQDVSRYFKHTAKAMEGVMNALPVVGIILDSGEMLNEWIPFLADLATGPRILQYRVEQEDGVLYELATPYIPPTAKIRLENYNPFVGEEVIFDARLCYDDCDRREDLQVRWDFDGDGVWDTGWSNGKIANYTMNQRGNFRTRLEVRDLDGLVGSETCSLVVGSIESFKIVLTWGQNPRDLDSHLYTPVIDGSSHHVWYSSKGSAISLPYVWLDLDDVSSYGPETIWFERFFSGEYKYSVYQYSSDGALATSGAHVEIISAGRLIASFDVPTDLSGRTWEVFTINGGTKTITPIN